ncbi:unnamed protein product [marine sediment metagenome]|uniref:Ferrous iron transporter FeoA-like domain-containing protein n=1 Tax=marine sediment metagenome TaxID=412755 RepID=X0WA85_9ZZZZ
MVQLKEGDRIKVIGFSCGRQCKDRFSCLGILEGKELEIITIQPFHGPITVSFGHSGNDTFTIGRGIMNKLEYEMIE